MGIGPRCDIGSACGPSAGVRACRRDACERGRTASAAAVAALWIQLNPTLRSTFPFVLALGAALVLATSCRAGRESSVPATPPNIVLITIDTLRADRIGRGFTPAIDGLAVTGVRFDNARTTVPLTLPSHVTHHDRPDAGGPWRPGQRCRLRASAFRSDARAPAAGRRVSNGCVCWRLRARPPVRARGWV